MNNKNFIQWLCVGLSVTSCLVLTTIIYIQTHSVLSIITFIICLVGFVVFWITLIIAIIQFKKNKK